MRSRTRRAGLLALVLLAAGPLRAQPAPALSSATLEAVEAAIAREMSRSEIPGLSGALVVDREIRWTSGFGLADLENDVPAGARSVFRLGSVSKPITAVAVLQLVEKGLVDLDAPVQKYVPSFPSKAWPVTARQLLAHLGGVRHYARGEFESTRHYTSLTEALTIFQDDALLHEPGTRYFYSTYGYNLLGCVVEAASGKSFLDYLGERIFAPSSMERTRADDVFAIVPHRAPGYFRTASGELRNSGLTDTSNKIPGGGLIATAADVARLAIALESGALLRAETRELMLTPQKTRDGNPTDYGLGLRLGQRGGHREAWHTGGQQGVSTILYMLPDQGLAVVLLCNLESVGPALLDLARRLSDLGQGGSGSEAPPPPRATRAPGPGLD